MLRPRSSYLAIALLLLISVGMVSALAEAKEEAKPSQKIRAILTCDQKVWDGKEPLNLHFSVRNDTKKPVRICSWLLSGIGIDMMATLPDNKVVRVSCSDLFMGNPREKDMITLQPGKELSTIYHIDPLRSFIAYELKSPSPGTYRFYANYTSYHMTGQKIGMERLTSNSVTVEVKQTKRR